MMSGDGPATERQTRLLRRFERFNQHGGKFRVAVINRCNLDCFFCHNEGMGNPRRDGRLGVQAQTLGDGDLQAIIRAFIMLGGTQLNITGGEPLAHPEIYRFLAQIEPGRTRVLLNTNGLLAQRLLAKPRLGLLHSILVSLHTMDDRVFREQLGGRSITQVTDNILALRDHGYTVEINYSLGDYNKHEFGDVLRFARTHEIALKAIALVRHDEDPNFYRGEWIDPRWLDQHLEDAGAVLKSTHQGFGGFTSRYQIGATRLAIKNIARGCLKTEFCVGCAARKRCSEGIYALRVGTDGWWKPCLLRPEGFRPVEQGGDYGQQILAAVSSMVGEWRLAEFDHGVPD